MPTYQYACKECGHQFEAVQSFSEASLTECPECTGPLRKLYGAVGVIFKGSGFYRNDSRSEAKSSASGKSSTASASSDSGSSGDSGSSSGNSGSSGNGGNSSSSSKSDSSSSSSTGSAPSKAAAAS